LDVTLEFQVGFGSKSGWPSHRTSTPIYQVVGRRDERRYQGENRRMPWSAHARKATQLRATRKMFSRGFEWVFDGYNPLVFGIGPVERRSDTFPSAAAIRSGSSRSSPTVRIWTIQTGTVNSKVMAQAVVRHESSFLAAPALAALIRSVLTRSFSLPGSYRSGQCGRGLALAGSLRLPAVMNIHVDRMHHHACPRSR
jgi:hypothetical protein